MRSGWMLLAGTAVACAMVIAGLWGWQGSADWAIDWGAGNPEMATWAVRSGAIALIAAAQAILIGFVAGQVYRRAKADTILAITAGAVCLAAAASAVACGIVGR